MIYLVLGLLGAVAGGVYLYGQGGFLLGGMLGLLLAAAIGQRNRLLALEQRLKTLETQLADKAAEPADAQPSGHEDTRTAARTNKKDPFPADESVEASDSSARPSTASASTDPMPSLELALADDATIVKDADAAMGGQTADSSPRPPGAAHQAIRQWLLGGNIVVRVGVVVLLFGFAFLVKYAASRNLLPLEIRLAGAFVAGVGLLLLGWRLRGSRFAYAITLQGGGIGVMYLTLFAAARLFHLVPLPLVFGLMIGLVFFSGVLAVLQNAAAMAVVGAAGGFMAPVLLSTGTGSHVMLFAYYALLNAGIFGIAWFRAWRWLNLLGFVFTFGIGSAWGLRYYQPPYFSSTEPFLILFFIFYLTIAVLFALRQPPRLKGLVDGTLVFGLPVVVFSLQIGLVKAIPYGLAYSALTMGLVYAGLATALWRHGEEGLRTLVEAFLALGVIFGSLAIPLALSGSWTAVTWSLEGAGLVWIGLRQRRWTARGFGLMLQIGSGVLFLIGVNSGATQMLVINSRFLGGMMMGLAGLFSAFMLERYQGRLHAWERWLGALIMAWGLAWWFATGIAEILRTLGHRHEGMGVAAYIGISALAMGLCHRGWHWQGMRFPAMGLLPVMLLTGALLGKHGVRHPLEEWWALVWPMLFAVHIYLLRVMDAPWPTRLRVVWHTSGALLAAVLLSWETGWLLDRVAGGGRVWAFITWGAIPALILWGVHRYGRRLKWPSHAWENAYTAWLPVWLAAGLGIWSVVGVLHSGDPRPLVYLPLLNPLDLVQAVVFFVVMYWIMDIGRETVTLPVEIAPVGLWATLCAGILVWLTAVVARSVHAVAMVPYSWQAMGGSALFQSAVSVLWGVLALGGMVTAHRLQHRVIWFCGAALLAVVVAKLFVVDLSGSGTISRIVSFLVVGILMLVIGFFTPLPPAVQKGSRA